MYINGEIVSETSYRTTDKKLFAGKNGYARAAKHQANLNLEEDVQSIHGKINKELFSSGRLEAIIAANNINTALGLDCTSKKEVADNLLRIYNEAPEVLKALLIIHNELHAGDVLPGL